jgi:hypothetical protein
MARIRRGFSGVKDRSTGAKAAPAAARDLEVHLLNRFLTAIDDIQILDLVLG